MKKIISILLLLILVLIGIISFRTLTATNYQRNIKASPAPQLSDSALLHFQQAISYKTISYADAKDWDSVPFLHFRTFLETTYPLVHQHLAREIVNNYTLVYKWQGSDHALAPYILMAHQDVVPIEEDTKKQWTFEPFSGTIKDGYIWGRGTTDDKINLISIFESAEKLLQQNFQPKRSIYFVFGHDEEIGGNHGAVRVAKLFKERNIKADLVLDEGGILTKEKIPGLTKPVALIGTAEKGYLTLKFSVNKKGGHSSQPENETAVDILTKALVTLRANPFEPKFVEASQDFMKYLGPEMKFPNNMAFANLWLFRPLVVNKFEQQAASNAMMRTTAVPTIINAGIKDNVVPTLATAIVNFRLLPGDSSTYIIKKVQEIIADNRVIVQPYDENISEASATTPTTSAAFQLIDSVVRKSYDSISTAPFLLIGATDSRHFNQISTNIIKFSPMLDPIGFHGINERVSIESFRHAIWFYEQLLGSCK
ncbi:MAG: M20 family peptidase [Bacteroidetes bacterium]|nr:M20 family peptidase [Bacteroidota bacterium]